MTLTFDLDPAKGSGARLLESPFALSLRSGAIQFPTISDPKRPWLHVDKSGLKIDLKDQWDYLPRNQGFFGTCAAFATVALYEAALARGGKCTRLSEADLFIEGNVLKWRCWGDDGDSCAGHVEGMNIAQLSDHVRTRGVLLGFDYDRLMAWYAQAKVRDGSRTRLSSGFLQNPFDYSELFGFPRATTRRLLEDYVTTSRAPASGGSRAAIARWAAGTTVVRRSWAPGDISVAPRLCRMSGAEQERFIDGELMRGRPVAVSMALDGLSNWGMTTPTSSDGRKYHAFIIQGLRVYSDGWNPIGPRSIQRRAPLISSPTINPATSSPMKSV